MKSILLTSTALVAFAGAAVAGGHEGVSFSGDAELGYNDEFDNGVFWSVGLGVSAAMDLDNGITATLSGDVELNGTNSTFDGNDVSIDDLVFGMATDTASLTFGDTAPAADALYSSAVTNVDADGFYDEGDWGEDGVLIARMSFGASEVGVSYHVFDTNGGADSDLDGLQIGANTTFGSVGLSFGYQEAVGAVDAIMAVSATAAVAGIDLGLSYADDGTETSTGVQAAFTFGDVSATVFYVSNDVNDDNYGVAVAYASGPLTVDALYHDGNDEDMQINATYDMGNGLSVFGGYRDEGSADDDTYFYVGGDYDLGGGANLRVSYADAEAAVGTALDELGASEDVKNGTTIAVSFTF